MKIFCLFLFASATALAQTKPYQSPANCSEFETRFLKAVPKKNSDPNEYLFRQWIEGSWNYVMLEYPEYATYVGYPGQNARWSEYTVEARDRQKNILRCQIDFGKKIDAKALSPKDQLTYKLFKQRLDYSLQAQQFDSDLIMITQLGGIHLDLPDILTAIPKNSVKDYNDALARLNALPNLIEQIQNMMKLGIEKKYTHVQFLMQKVPGQINDLLVQDYSKNPVYQAFKDLPNTLTEDQKLEVQAKAKEVISAKVIPAFKSLKKFIETEYIPKCRQEIAATKLPKGPAFYSYSSRYMTTTDWEPKKIHELGLSEVARISKEMEALKDSVKFKGDLQAFNRYLNSDSQFFFREGQELISGYRDIAKRLDPELPRQFGTLPRLPYGVKAMPDFKAPSAPTAYYHPGSQTSGRAGFFEANTYDLKSRPKWEMEALTMHEAVPGHHLQISLAQELADLPDFRKHEGYTAFVEGWGLYAESLGYDMGMYKDPYSKYGQLVYDMWRAVRLVVDTGIHSMDWSKQKALDYMMEKVGKPKLDIENEIDRYITWPGQALAYKVGQLKFQELKDKSKKTLGENFDVREFHDEVLRHGGVPLNILEDLHAQWLKGTVKKLAAQSPKNAK